jgi:hypothetical protein
MASSSQMASPPPTPLAAPPDQCASPSFAHRSRLWPHGFGEAVGRDIRRTRPGDRGPRCGPSRIARWRRARAALGWLLSRRGVRTADLLPMLARPGPSGGGWSRMTTRCRSSCSLIEGLLRVSAADPRSCPCLEDAPLAPGREDIPPGARRPPRQAHRRHLCADRDDLDALPFIGTASGPRSDGLGPRTSRPWMTAGTARRGPSGRCREAGRMMHREATRIATVTACGRWSVDPAEGGTPRSELRSADVPSTAVPARAPVAADEGALGQVRRGPATRLGSSTAREGVRLAPRGRRPSARPGGAYGSTRPVGATPPRSAARLRGMLVPAEGRSPCRAGQW